MRVAWNRNRMIGCLLALACVGLLSTSAWASANQSVDVLVVAAHPAGTIHVDLKALGFTPVHADAPYGAADGNGTVADKGAAALCSKILALIPACVDGCDPGDGSISVNCNSRGAHGESFVFAHAVGGPDLDATANVSPGDIQNLNANGWPNLDSDIASRVLLQVSPNGVLGTVNVIITHTQGGQNPKTASFAITAGNVNDSLAIHNGIRDAINALAFAPDVVAVTHPASDAVPPLTYSVNAFCPPSASFVEITNAAAAGVTHVNVVGVSTAGSAMAVTVEGTENTTDTPALGAWGIILVLAMLLLSGYWLMRRRRGMATA